jgi:chaperonin GroEL
MDYNSKKSLLFAGDARDELFEGVQKLASAVSVTMGPCGQNVVIERRDSSPHLTKDGVTVARSINLENKFQNLGVQMVKEAASRTADEAGDGTTAATVLARAIFGEGLKMLAAGFEPSEIRKGIKMAVEKIIEELTNTAIPVTHDEEIIQVGTISANGERAIGELICEAMNAVGRDGIITVEEAKGFKTSLEIVEGLELNRGFLSPYFVTDYGRMEAVLEKPCILLYNKKLNSLQEILPVLEKVAQSQRSLLIIADDVDGDAMQGLVVNRLKGTLEVCAIRAPEFGEARFNTLGDLAVMLKANATLGIESPNLDDVTLSDLGTCRKVIVSKTKSIFIDCAGDKKDIEKRVQDIRHKLSDPTLEDMSREIEERRLAMLAGGVAVLRVGGSTEIELLERKDRVDDALHATQAAVEEGILAGGGVALVKASRCLEKIDRKLYSNDYLAGINIVKASCAAPLMQIVQNAGGPAQVVLERVKRIKDGKGYDIYTDQWVNMFDAGIIDPLKVVRYALEHASSAACNLLSVGCAMVEVEHTEEIN